MKTIFKQNLSSIEPTLSIDIMVPNGILFVPGVALLLLTIFLGMFVIFLGIRKRAFLKKCISLPATIEEISYPSFKATVSWDYMGITHYSSPMGLYALVKMDKFRVLYSPSTLRTTFDLWTHNGKGLIIGGATICFLSGLALYLLVVFS